MDPLIVAAGLSAGMNLLGNVFANRSNISNVDKQNRFNLDMWNRANAYNTPLMQRQRYEDAGINPALALSNITPGTTQSMMSAQHQPVVNPMQGVSEYTGQAIASTQVEAQSNLLKAQEEKTKAETIGVLLNNEHIPNYMRSLIAQQYTTSAYNQAKTETENTLRSEMLESQKIQNRLGVQNIELVSQKVLTEQGVQRMNDTINKLNVFKLKNIAPLEAQQLKAVISSLYSTIALNSSQVRLNDANVGKVKQETLLTHQKYHSERLTQGLLTQQTEQLVQVISGMKIDNKYKEQILQGTIKELTNRSNYYDKVGDYFQWQKWTNIAGEVNKAVSTAFSAFRGSGISTTNTDRTLPPTIY